METLIANVSGQPQRVTKGGREYYVAQATLIVPGVLAGSRGPIYYSPEETGRRPSDWDGMPLVIHHPVVNGRDVSARDPDIAEAYEAGRNYRTKYTGKLASEVWFDVEQTRRVAPLVLNSLASGKKIELSTGLFMDLVPAPEGSVHNGRPYAFIAKNLRPDHIAILPDAVGACSIADGCGVNNESDGEPAANNDESNIQGASSPNIPRGTDMMKLSSDDRKRIVSDLVANCNCSLNMPWRGKTEAELNQFSDEVLNTMNSVREAMVANSTPAKDLPGFIDPQGNRHVYDSRSNQWATFPAPVQANNGEQKQAVPAGEQRSQNVTNTQGNGITPGTQSQSPPVATIAPRSRTADEWAAEKFPGKTLAQVEQAVRNILEIEQRETAALVEKLTANLAGEARTVMQQKYGEMPLDTLRLLVANMQTTEQPIQTQQPAVTNNFAGAAGAPVARPAQTQKHLSLPKYNFRRN